MLIKISFEHFKERKLRRKHTLKLINHLDDFILQDDSSNAWMYFRIFIRGILDKEEIYLQTFHLQNKYYQTIRVLGLRLKKMLIIMIKLMIPCFLRHSLSSDQINEKKIVTFYSFQHNVLRNIVFFSLLFLIYNFFKRFNPRGWNFNNCTSFNSFTIF